MTPSPEQQAQIMSAAIKQLSQEGRYDEALALVGQMCEAARSAVGERSFPYATLLAKMADLYRL